MKRYVIRRLLMAIPLLLAISFVCFVFINLIPSNPAEVALRVQQMPVITEEAVAEMEEMLGLIPNVRVIMCSAVGQEMMIQKALTIGASDFIVKPFKADEFSRIVNRCLEQ